MILTGTMFGMIVWSRCCNMMLDKLSDAQAPATSLPVALTKKKIVNLYDIDALTAKVQLAQGQGFWK